MFNCAPKEVGKSCEKGTGILALISGFPFQISVLEIFLQSYETNSKTTLPLSNANLPHLALNNLWLYLSSTQHCSQAPPSFVHRPHPASFVLKSHPAFQRV